MNLIDAIRSGKPFRRNTSGWGGWWTTESPLALTHADILADDWETKPEPREWWVVLREGGSFVTVDGSEAMAKHCAALAPGRTVVHVREVVG